MKWDFQMIFTHIIAILIQITYGRHTNHRFLNLHCPHVGRFVHPYDCHGFVDCKLQGDGHLLLHQGSCYDQIFHPELQKCVDQKSISCGDDLIAGNLIFSNINQAKSSQENYQANSSQENHQAHSSQENYQTKSSQENYQVKPLQQKHDQTKSSQENDQANTSQENYQSKSSQENYQATSLQENEQAKSSQENDQTKSSQDNYQGKSSQENYKYSAKNSDVKISETDMIYLNNLLQSISSDLNSFSHIYTDTLSSDIFIMGDSEIKSKIQNRTALTIDEKYIESDISNVTPINNHATDNEHKAIDVNAMSSPLVPQNSNTDLEFVVHQSESEKKVPTRINKNNQHFKSFNKDRSRTDIVTEKVTTHTVLSNRVRDIAQLYLAQKGRSKLFRSPEHDHICTSGASFGCANCREAVVCGGGRAYLAPCTDQTTCRDAMPFEGGVCHPVHSDGCTCKNEDIIKPDPYDPFAFLQCTNKALSPSIFLCPENSVFDIANVSCVAMPEFPTCTGAGTFPHPNDCQWYYTCLPGPTENTWLRRPHRCGPHNQVYSKVLARCAPAASLPAADPCTERKISEIQYRCTFWGLIMANLFPSDIHNFCMS